MTEAKSPAAVAHEALLEAYHKLLTAYEALQPLESAAEGKWWLARRGISALSTLVWHLMRDVKRLSEEEP